MAAAAESAKQQAPTVRAKVRQEAETPEILTPPRRPDGGLDPRRGLDLLQRAEPPDGRFAVQGADIGLSFIVKPLGGGEPTDSGLRIEAERAATHRCPTVGRQTAAAVHLSRRRDHPLHHGGSVTAQRFVAWDRRHRLPLAKLCDFFPLPRAAPSDVAPLDWCGVGYGWLATPHSGQGQCFGPSHARRRRTSLPLWRGLSVLKCHW